MPEVRGLPSIPFPELPGYYSPLRLPPRPASKILLWATTPHPRRVSHVTQNTFPTCHPHYPGGRKRVPISVSSSSPFGLPRILGGSASTTLLSRPAQGSLSLWPVGCSPPIADFCPRSFSRKVSLPNCPGSYRDEPTTPRVELSSTGILHLRGAPIYWGQAFGQKLALACQSPHFAKFPGMKCISKSSFHWFPVEPYTFQQTMSIGLFQKPVNPQ